MDDKYIWAQVDIKESKCLNFMVEKLHKKLKIRDKNRRDEIKTEETQKSLDLIALEIFGN